MEACGDSVKNITLSVRRLTKIFNRRTIFKDVSFELSRGNSLAITGRNGSGKSTLLKILSGVLSSTFGEVCWTLEGKQYSQEEVKHDFGLVSPYLQLYDEFTALENLHLLSEIRGMRNQSDERIKLLLEQLLLWERRDDFIRTYSSGMKQRLKYAFALLHEPTILFLDEPTANLDTDGIQAVRTFAKHQRESGILIVATNDEQESQWCENHIHLGHS
ncbi:MAG: ABC transporter ATP-binding protein [bacterium]